MNTIEYIILTILIISIVELIVEIVYIINTSLIKIKILNMWSSNIESDKITIYWRSSNNSNGNTIAYISYKTTGNYEVEYNTTSTRKTIYNLSPNTYYTFRIKVKDNNGNYSRYAYSQAVKTLDTKIYNKEMSDFNNKKSLDKNDDYLSKKEYLDTIFEIIPYNREYPDTILNIKDIHGKDEKLYPKLERGTAILKKEGALNQYLFSFADMHNAKLEIVYNKLFEKLPMKNEAIEIIDYACGQGLASISLLNNLDKKYNFNICNVKKIILIEPSKVALERANNFLYKTSNIKLIDKKLDDISTKCIETENDTVKFHLFSNILDMGDNAFSIYGLAKKIRKSQKGLNYFISVSPMKYDKLRKFMKCFNSYHKIASLRESTIENSKNKNWHITYNIFKLNL